MLPPVFSTKNDGPDNSKRFHGYVEVFDPHFNNLFVGSWKSSHKDAENAISKLVLEYLQNLSVIQVIDVNIKELTYLRAGINELHNRIYELEFKFELQEVQMHEDPKIISIASSNYQQIHYRSMLVWLDQV